ncbi:MAG: ABC transporter permease [Candidatus Sumerlaeota bacterium]
MSESAAPAALQPSLVTAVWKRELRSYIHTPGTWVALAFFLLLSGSVFISLINDYVAASAARAGAEVSVQDAELPLNATDRIITSLFLSLNFLMLFLVPMLTMRLLSEERRSGTFELLVSTPLGNWEILLGKFLAALTMGTAVLVATFIYPAVCMVYTDPEIPVIISSYIGLFLIITAYTAFGIFASAVTESQIAAAVLSFSGLILFQMVDWLFKAGVAGKIGAAISLRQHSEAFPKGIINTSDVSFFILFTLFFLFMSAQVLDARRWRV